MFKLDSIITPELLARFTGQRFDANETAMFTRQLEYIYTQTYDIEYPAFKARSMLPVDTRVPSGAESHTYRQFNKFGSAALVHNYAKDFPNAEVQGKEFTQKIKSLGSSYQYSIQDIRASALSGIPLETMRAEAARFAIEAKLDKLAAIGDADSGLVGFANHSALTSTAPAASGVWTGKTPTQILADINAMQNQIFTATKGVHTGTTLALGTVNYGYLATTARAPGFTDDSLLQFILKQSPWLKEIVHWNRLDTVASSLTAPRVMLYEKDPRVVSLVIPQEFEQLPPQLEGMSATVNCHMRTGGVVLRYPLAATYMDGV